MFVSVLKNGAAPSKPESLRSLSVEPQGIGGSSFGEGVVDLADVNSLDKIEKS